MIKKTSVTLGVLFFLSAGSAKTVLAQTTYPEVQSLPFYTTIGDYKESAPANPGSAILEQYKINMVGFDNEQLTWAWQIFNQVANTNLKNLISGVIIKKVVDAHGYSAQVGCNDHGQGYYLPAGHGVELHPHTEEAKFKLTILHELGHIVYNCNGALSVKWKTDWETIYASEGGITTYAKDPACVIGYNDPNLEGRKRSEDFAESIAYYLIPDAPERSIEGCPPKGGAPFADGAFPRHAEFIRSILEAN